MRHSAGGLRGAAAFANGGTLSHTGAGLLMALFVVFVLESIVYQHRLVYDEGLCMMGVGENPPSRGEAAPGPRQWPSLQ